MYSITINDNNMKYVHTHPLWRHLLWNTSHRISIRHTINSPNWDINRLVISFLINFSDKLDFDAFVHTVDLLCLYLSAKWHFFLHLLLTICLAGHSSWHVSLWHHTLHQVFTSWDPFFCFLHSQFALSRFAVIFFSSHITYMYVCKVLH